MSLKKGTSCNFFEDTGMKRKLDVDGMPRLSSFGCEDARRTRKKTTEEIFSAFIFFSPFDYSWAFFGGCLRAPTTRFL